MRVVSLTCSNTEIVRALGQSASLVGVDDHSDFPPNELAGLARVGKDLSIDISKVVSLKPDLILASLTVPGHERVVAEVAQTGIPFIAPRPQSLADVAANIREIADLLQVPEAGKRLSKRLLSETSPVLSPCPPKVIVEWWPKPCIVATRRSWVTDLIERAGGMNPFAPIDKESAVISPQQAVEAAPQVVIVSWCGVPERKLSTHQVLRRKGWENVPAVQHNRISIIPEAYLGRPGPRLMEGYRALKQVIQGAQEGTHEAP